MKQLIKMWDDPITVLEEMKRIEQEYKEQGYEVKRIMNCIQLIFDDGWAEIWWENGAIWQEIKEDKKMDKRNADVIERDDNGNIIGWGSHADYGIHDVDVMDGKGYYDSNGHFHYYHSSYNMED